MWANLRKNFKATDRDQHLNSTAKDASFARAANIAQTNHVDTIIHKQASEWAESTTIVNTAAALANLIESRSEDHVALSEMRALHTAMKSSCRRLSPTTPTRCNRAAGNVGHTEAPSKIPTQARAFGKKPWDIKTRQHGRTI